MKNQVWSLVEGKLKKRAKMLALLIDPDKFDPRETPRMAAGSGADLILVGGSLITAGDMEEAIRLLKKKCNVPVVIFPGSIMQIYGEADAILNLSLISGRNPEFLIGQHVVAAPALKKSGLEILPTGYMLIESGEATTASYMSGTSSIPRNKDGIASCTAMAGEMLGLKMIYMDAGSGAKEPVSLSMVREVKKSISAPLIVGGGIRDTKTAVNICKAGADVLVIGTGAEQDVSFAKKIALAIHSI